jgi:N-6 DNA Methylase
LCQGEDSGLVAFLREVCAEAAKELPLLFDPDSPLTLVAPSPDALQKCVRALSGETVDLTRRAGDRADGLTDEVFREPDLLGWVYQYWNDEEKDRVFEAAARGKKITGADIVPATCIYTEDYMVRFLVENSLGALWAKMHPDSQLSERWPYFVRDAERPPSEAQSVADLTFLDPACGSGHFLVYAFDLLWDMYQEEGRIADPAQICRSILERNLYGIDIDERSVQIAAVALYLKTKERAPHFRPRRVNLVAANASMPPDAVQRYLKAHPEDEPIRGVLETIFEGLENVNEVGSLLQIEEQLNRAIEELRKHEVRLANNQTKQLSLLPLLGLPEPAVQGRLELDMLPPWETWKQAVLDRLHQQFQEEADAQDVSTAIFGTEAEKGLDLIELLSRRYDMVATNPPYMGSKNMGPRLKTYVQRHYPEGKRDLYAAFIQRCLQLAKPGGKVAMVTQQSWMFLRSFTELRKGVLEQQTIECLAHLGEHGFEDPAAAGAFVALFALSREPPTSEHRLWAARLIGPKIPEEKASLLGRARQGEAPAVVSCPLQGRFLDIPQVPLCYWLRERFMDLLNTTPIGSVATFTDGVAVRTRFLRFAWEVPDGSRWMPYAKGGEYGRWTGDDRFSYDWEFNGTRIKTWVLSRHPADKLTLLIKSHDTDVPWVSWSDVARGSIGCRLVGPGYLIAHTGPAARSTQIPLAALAAVLQSRAATALLRAITPTLHFTYRDVMRLPLPAEMSPRLSEYANRCLSFKHSLVALHPTERTFSHRPPSGQTPRESYTRATELAEAAAAMLHTLEGLSEREVFATYGIAGEDLWAVLDETGMPAAWFPLIAGYDALLSLPEELKVDAKLLEPLASERRLIPSPVALTGIKRALRALYQAGPGAKVEDEEDAAEGDENDEEEHEAAVSGARIPIPTETLIEELSQKLELHPISVYWLLKELREQEGVISLPELRPPLAKADRGRRAYARVCRPSRRHPTDRRNRPAHIARSGA